MTETVQPTRTSVVSADGTEIAVFASGEGRPLVVVHGTTSDHTTWRLATSLLEREVTVYAVDRRGRGGSGDSADYSLAKEYEDVAAVVDWAAETFGAPVDLFGHSYGGNVAFGAALRTPNIRKLALYEGWPVPNVAHRTLPHGQLEHLESLLAQGRPEQMLELFYRDMVRMSQREIDSIKSGPTWLARVAAAHTVPREIRAFGEQAFDARWAAQILVPVLLLVGGDSPAEIQADPGVVSDALPDATMHVLASQAHMAHLTDPYTFAAAILAFLRD